MLLHLSQLTTEINTNAAATETVIDVMSSPVLISSTSSSAIFISPSSPESSTTSYQSVSTTYISLNEQTTPTLKSSNTQSLGLTTSIASKFALDSSFTTSGFASSVFAPLGATDTFFIQSSPFTSTPSGIVVTSISTQPERTSDIDSSSQLYITTSTAVSELATASSVAPTFTPVTTQLSISTSSAAVASISLSTPLSISTPSATVASTNSTSSSNGDKSKQSETVCPGTDSLFGSYGLPLFAVAFALCIVFFIIILVILARTSKQRKQRQGKEDETGVPALKMLQLKDDQSKGSQIEDLQTFSLDYEKRVVEKIEEHKRKTRPPTAAKPIGGVSTFMKYAGKKGNHLPATKSESSKPLVSPGSSTTPSSPTSPTSQVFQPASKPPVSPLILTESTVRSEFPVLTGSLNSPALTGSSKSPTSVQSNRSSAPVSPTSAVSSVSPVSPTNKTPMLQQTDDTPLVFNFAKGPSEFLTKRRESNLDESSRRRSNVSAGKPSKATDSQDFFVVDL